MILIAAETGSGTRIGGGRLRTVGRRKIGTLEMVKAKSKATVMAADGAGGMVKVEDRRVETELPIRFKAPNGGQADTWPSYLNDESHRGDWSASSPAALEPPQTSGTTVAP